MSTEPDQRFEDVYEPRGENYTTLRDYHLIEQVIQEITPLVTELEALLTTLPTVKADGRSDCPFAPEMYRQKEQLEAKVRDRLSALRRMNQVVQQEMDRCTRNLQRIGADMRKLNSNEVRRQCQKAETRQEEEYMEALSTRRRLDQALLRADATVGASRRKVFPGNSVYGGGDTHMPASATTDPPARSDEGGVRDEVDGLLALDAM